MVILMFLTMKYINHTAYARDKAIAVADGVTAFNE